MIAKIKKSLKKKIGPFPVWGWALVTVGGILAWRHYRANQAAAMQAAGNQQQYSPTTPPDLSYFPNPTPMDSGGGSGGGSGTDLSGLLALLGELLKPPTKPPKKPPPKHKPPKFHNKFLGKNPAAHPNRSHAAIAQGNGGRTQPHTGPNPAAKSYPRSTTAISQKKSTTVQIRNRPVRPVRSERQVANQRPMPSHTRRKR